MDVCNSVKILHFFCIFFTVAVIYLEFSNLAYLTTSNSNENSLQNSVLETPVLQVLYLLNCYTNSSSHKNPKQIKKTQPSRQTCVHCLYFCSWLVWIILPSVGLFKILKCIYASMNTVVSVHVCRVLHPKNWIIRITCLSCAFCLPKVG